MPADDIGDTLASMMLSSGALRVLALFLEAPQTGRYVLEIAKEAGVGSSTLYPLLARLEAAGWLTSEWEDLDPKAEGRPARRLYWITDLGIVEARNEIRPLLARLRNMRPGLEAI